MRAIAGSWLITGDAAQAPIAGGALVLDGDGRVLAVGEQEALRARYPQLPWERHRAVLLPGLVNAHTHLELSALSGQVPGGSGFGPWVTALMQQRERCAPERDEQAIEAGVSALLAAGTAAVGEVSNTLAAVPALASAPLWGSVFHEIAGLRRDGGEAKLAQAEARRRELGAWPAQLRYAPAAHTPYTVHPQIVREILRRARELGARSSLHLCEHAAERAYLASGAGPVADFFAALGVAAPDWSVPGIDPVRYAAELGALSPDVLCVHLTDARPDELAAVAGAGAPVVLCPRSNLHIELRLPPLPAMLELGLRPALGTDSLASSPSLDVLQEARALAHRFAAVPARTLIAMATSYGAEALGLQQEVGRLAPGLAPGVLAFEHAEPAPSDPERFVLSGAASRRQMLARPDLRRTRPREAA